MKIFGLFTKNSPIELIHKVHANDLTEAIVLFTKIKNLEHDSLLKIFNISEIVK